MMTNLLNGAHVANKLFSTIARLRLLLVMLLTLTITTNAWGETVTFTPDNCTNWTSSQAEQTQTIDGITLHSTGAANNTQLRLYSGATHTFTSTVGNITSILFTCTTNGTKNYGPGKMTGDGYVAGTGKTGEWTGNSAEVTLKGGQSRCTSIVVTYTPSSGGTEPPTPATQYTIKWHTAKGVTTDVILNEGAAITQPATDPTMSGYVFMGWTEACEVASNGSDFTAITNFGTATEDKDYYAVFAEATTPSGGGGSTTETLKGNQLSYSGTNGYVNFTATTTSGTWSGKANYNKNGYIQINKNNNNYHIGSPTFASNVTSIKITTTNNSAASRTFYICSSNSTAQPSSGDLGSHKTTTTNESFTIDLTKEAKQFYIYSSGAVYISQIDVTYGSGGAVITYSDYLTTCSKETSTSTYTVKHCKEGLEAGSYPDDLIETETLEGTIGDQVTPGRKNYTGFTAPSGQTETILENGALVVTYKYTRKSYTLTWELGDGIVTTEGTAAPLNATGTISQSVRYETPITAPIVQREGYRFNKWNTSVSDKMPASDKSFTATWVKTWDITWKAQGNTIQTVTVDTDGKLTLPTEEVATCEGMTHIGWTEIENYTSDTDAPNDFFTYAIGTVSENKIYHAVYALSCGYTKLDWGSEVPEGKYLISTGTNTIYGQNGTTKTYLGATAYAPTRELKPEYEVYIREVGTALAIQLLNTMWVGLASSSSTNTNLTIDPPETDAAYTWKYTKNGIQNQSAESRYLQINGAGSEGRVYTTTGSGSTWHPTYLYARNNGGYYTTCQTSVAIDYDLNGGTGNMSNTRVKSGSDYIIPTAVPTQVGKTFTHWSDGTNTYAAGATINNLTNDITLTAQWKVAQHTVTLNPNYPNGKTGTFKDKGGNTISGNLILTYDYNTASMSLTDLYQSIELEGYQFNGWYSATSGGSRWTSTNTITKDITVYAQWSKLHTVTFNTGTNNPTIDAIKGTSETGITLPAGPTPACSADGWKFAGWAAISVEETTTEPTLFSKGNNYKPIEDCTLYAVYSKEKTEEGGSTTPTEATLSFASKDQRTSFSSTQQVWEQNGITMTNNKHESSSDVADYANPARFYAGSQIIINAPKVITKIVATCIESKHTTALVNSVGKDASSNNNVVTIIPAASSTTYTIAKLDAQVQMSSLTVTYLAESGPTTTITYNSNPSCFEPVWEGATIDKTSFTVNCGERSPMDGANGAAKITFPTDKIYDFTSAITIEATTGFVVSTSKSVDANYKSSVSLSPLVGTTNANTFYDKFVYVRAEAPAMSEEDLSGTITIKNSKGETLQTFSVTADVTCTQYTLTLIDRGVSTEQATKYYAGETINEAPADPEGVCTDPIHYVFDGWATSTVAGGSTTYTKVSFPYTMPAKATTLYAVYRYTEGNAGSDKFMSVDKEIGELVSGMDYVLTGYYDSEDHDGDDNEYAMSITAYETGKYKTKYVDVQESSILYEEDIPYYEFTTTDNEIIWTIEGDEANGYSFQNKSNNKYLAVSADKLTLSDNAAKFTIEHETGVKDGEDVYYMSLLIQPVGSTKYLSSYYKDATAGVLFNLHTASTLSLYLYKRVASNLYTTSPACGPMLEITSGKDIYVTSGYGTGRNTVIAQQTVEYRATRLKTQNGSAEGTAPDVKVAANGVTMGGVVTNNVKVVELTQNKELIGDKYTITGTVTVQYTPTANNLQEDIQVQLAVDYNTDAKDNFTVHARSLPSEFVIAAKQGDKWYALNADMSGSDAEKANGYLQVDNIEDPTKATFAPCNTIYTFDGMVDGGNKEYMRFQGIDGKYLWAASAGNTGIQNYAKNTPAAGTIAYNWQLYTNDNETYQLQNEGNGRKLGLSKDLNFGMYSYVSTLQQDIRILPYEAKCIYNYAPSNLKVSVLKSTYVTLTWDAVAGATKYQYSTDATNWNDAGTEPTVTINGLTEGADYTYYIRAYHEDAGVSQECIDYAEITFTTANCDDVPTDITYTADLTSITVTWTAVSTNCVVRLYSDEACTSVVKFADELNGSVTFSQLDRNTTYYVRVFAGGICASQIIPVKTEDVKVDIVEWMENGIIVDINTNETVGVTLENEVSYGSGAGQNAEELFFSKYFEGSGSLKLLAIYNGTGKDVDLSTYRIDRGSNGDATNISKTYDLSQLGTIKNGQEIIFYSWPLNTDAEASVYTCSQSFLDGKTKESGVDANPRWILCDAKTHNGVKFETMDFSGDDPLLFYKGSTLIDVFGVSTAADRPSKKTQCEGRSEESWSAAEVTNMDYGKTEADFEDGNVPEGVDLLNPTITAYTARVIMFRKNTVVSGNDAVTKNVTDFVTLADEWEARSVCHSGGDGDLTCGAYQELGKFDYSDYYTKYETMGDKQVFDESARNDDGTVTVEISDLYKQSCRNIRIKLSNESGQVLTDREYKVPIMITTTQGTDGEAFLALQENLATVEVDGNGNPTGNKTNLTLAQVREICKTCDVVVRDNATLMKMADDAANDHPQVRNVYVYENSSLIVPNGTNYTINNLSLRRKQDAVASVSAYPDALKLPESAAAPISLDFRLSAESWHWFTLPYDCNISEVKWIDGTPAKYNEEWFLMTYDGEKRAATQAGGCWKAYTGTTIKAGEGFILAINGNINNPAHTYELRFPMSKEVLAEEGTDKTVDVRAWGVENNIRPNHKGWNLVGNPYLAYYQRNNITNFEGLRLGQLTGPDPQTGYWEQTGDVPYVVVPVGAGWIAYEQVLASETDLLPFTAYFVQVGNDGTHNSTQDLKVAFDHTKLQLSATPMPASIIQRSATEDEEPIIVGVSLTNAKGESDKTSLIIDDQYTDEYEMHADFFKWFGDYYTYYTKPVLYTVGADQGKRAFNALNEELATQPVALGMYAAQAGEYTFTLDLRSDLSHVEEIWLHDATENIYTNLLQDSYTFSTGKINGEGRFFLSVKMKPQQEPDPDPEPTPDPTPDSDPETSLDDIVANRVWATVKDNVIYISGLLSDAQLWIYDAAGRLMHYDQTKYYQHTYLVPQGGAYFVRVQGTMQTQTIKVVVK